MLSGLLACWLISYLIALLTNLLIHWLAGVLPVCLAVWLIDYLRDVVLAPQLSKLTD